VLFILLRLGEHLNKSFKDATADDLMDFFCNLKPVSDNGKSADKYADRTMWTYKASVKTFWKCLFGIDKKARESPSAVNWIERNSKIVKSYVPKDVLTRDEINVLIKCVSSARDKAIIALLFDTGMRCGELLSLRRSQIKFYDDYAEFEVNGKTGIRECIAIESAPYLKKQIDWLDKNKHIIKKGFEDYLWLNINRGGWVRNYGRNIRNVYDERGSPLTRDGVGSLLKRAGKKAKIDKKIWTHLFRHSSATYWAQFLNEAEMRIKFGWSRDSNMPSVYINLDYSKLKEKQLKKAGKWKEVEKNDKQMFKHKDCPFCTTENLPGAEYCSNCGKPMTIQKIKETEKQEQLLYNIQSAINELKRLEKKGFNLQTFNSFNEHLEKKNMQEQG